MIHRNEDGTFAKGTNAGTRFKKGNTPWNKDLKGLHLNPETEFREDKYVGENHPSWKGGVQTSKKMVLTYGWVKTNETKGKKSI